MAQIKRVGFGQVEPNHLSARSNGQVYAQLPAKVAGGASAMAIVEQGMFLKYNMADGRISTDGDGEPMLVYCEEKNYDERAQGHKNFALLAADSCDGYAYPRLLKTAVGDIFTTNTFGANTSAKNTVNGIALVLKDKVKIGADGYLAKSTDGSEDIVFQVVEVTTMPDMQPAVKLQRIK